MFVKFFLFFLLFGLLSEGLDLLEVTVGQVIQDRVQSDRIQVEEYQIDQLIELENGARLAVHSMQRFDLPEANESAVYARMISERQQIAEKYTADGNYEASLIRNDVDKQVNIIVSNAEAEAAKLQAEGEAEYMRLLGKAYNTEDKQEFYKFTQALEALKSTLNGDEKTIILGKDSDLAQILTNP